LATALGWSACAPAWLLRSAAAGDTGTGLRSPLLAPAAGLALAGGFVVAAVAFVFPSAS
jgi:hypothetical protein